MVSLLYFRRDALFVIISAYYWMLYISTYYQMSFTIRLRTIHQVRLKVNLLKESISEAADITVTEMNIEVTDGNSADHKQ